MLVGGRWSGWNRAWAHTIAYTRAYFFIGLLTALFGPVIILTMMSMIVVVPAAFFAHLLFVRLFRGRSWVREPRRAWIAGAAGVPMVVVGSLASLAMGEPPEAVQQLGFWATAIFVLGIPVFFSNLGVLIGYLPARGIPPSRPESGIRPTGSSRPP